MKTPSFRQQVGMVSGITLLVCCGKALGCGGSSAEGEAGQAYTTPCVDVYNCPQPPDPRCGYAICQQGTCVLVIEPGPIASQKRGDCRQIFCNSLGLAKEKEDSTDVYDDGKPCTFDTCEEGVPKNLPIPNTFACPGLDSGVCYKGECVECIDGDTLCPGAGMTCDFFWCEKSICGNYCNPGCSPCAVGQSPCNGPDTCLEGVCIDEVCAAPTCQDSVKNGDEVGIDCGPSCGKLCPISSTCKFPSDCDSEICWAGVCEAPTCTDGVKNGDEEGVDCGGGCAMLCKSSP